MIERNTQEVKGAALVLEMGNGERRVYRLKPERGITLETEHVYENVGFEDLFSRPRPELVETLLTITGALLDGRVWQGPMPGDDGKELGPQVLEQ